MGANAHSGSRRDMDEGTRNEAAYIDREELPFTAEEIRQAACVWVDDADARHLADHLARQGPAYIAERKKRREGWRRAGVQDSDRMPLGGWVYPAWLLPTLSVLSPTCRARVQALMAERWTERAQAHIRAAQIRSAEEAGLWPKGEAVLEKLRDGAAGRDEPTQPQDLVVRQEGSPLPEPTAAMRDAAERKVRDEVRAWDALADQARRRLKSRGETG